MIKFRLLEIISKNPKLSQKKLAELASVSIGKVNYLINELVEGQYLEVEKSGRSFHYIVTEKARDFLLKELDEFQETKLNLHDNEEKEVKQAVILAAGNKTDFDKPVCLVEIAEGVTLLDRNLRILKNNGIEKVVIVTGYKKEAFQSVHLPNNVILVQNDRYKWTGTMASLAEVKNEINDDFLLIEDDILIEEVAIQKLIAHEERDCILIMNESDSRDQAFIEIRNGYLYKISKDLSQLNRIDGEMIGVTKISMPVFGEMLDLYKDNRNPYMNYEYMLLDVSRKIDIGYLKMNDLVWGEIDNLDHYDQVKRRIYPLLKRKEENLKKTEVRKLVASALNVPVDAVQNIISFGGMTNINYRVTVNGENFVARIPGNGTKEFINRIQEKENLELGSRLGINPEQLYFNLETGMKITRMIPGAETLTPRTTKKEEIMVMVTEVLRKLHHSGEVMNNTFDPFELMEKYEALAFGENIELYDGYWDVKEDVMALKNYYHSLEVNIAPCHIDCLHENFIKSGDNKLYLIDWEYAGMCDPMWDIAAHMMESEFSPSEEELFLIHYFQGEASVEDRKKILLHKIFQDFLWSIWTSFKEAKGDDFGTYGIDRFNRGKENIKLFKRTYLGVAAQ
ncbi:MAG TPA: NTP transferase domain-containing protein [Bacillaceae bacterium]